MKTYTDKIAIMCSSQWQVLNAINIVVSNIEESGGKRTDIFIFDCFRGAENICRNLRREEIFGKIISAPILNEKPSNIDILNKLLFPKNAFKKYKLVNECLTPNSYQKIFIGHDSWLAIAMKRVNRKATVLVFDEGTSDYVGNNLLRGKGWKYRLLAKTFHLGAYSYCTEKLYLNCKEICRSTITDNIEGLPELNEKNSAVQIAKRVFNFSESSLLSMHKFIILGQPLEEMRGYNGNPIEILYPKENQKLFLVRKHQRQQLKDNDSMTFDTINNMWELECIFNITNEHVLIACCSTAQITPKIVAKKEPYIIFTYKLFLNENSGGYEEYNEMVRIFVDFYTQKDKVFVPDSLEKYYEIIKTLTRIL